MDNKSVALWTLVAAYVGAIIQVPNLWMDRVLGTSMLLALIAFITCVVIARRRARG